MKSVKDLVAYFRASNRRANDELAFLPAALEIEESPPAPAGRAIGASIITLFCLATTWAYWGKVDIVTAAPGKIVPDGRSKVVQPFETAVVRAVHVRDGQKVKAGDVLIELDPTLNEADRDRLRSELVSLQLDLARLRAALSPSADPVADFRAPQGASVALVATQIQYLTNQMNEHRSKLAALDRQRAQKVAERGTIAATIDKLSATIPLLQQRVDIRKAMGDFSSKLTYVETLQLLVEQQKEIGVQQSRYQEAEAAIAAIGETRAQTAAEFRRTVLGDLTTAEQKAAATAQELAKAEQKTRLQTLTAPVDGTVQQLAVHTVAGVVTAAESLLVVPTDSHLEIEAMISNRDIGFVQEGQEVEIKVDTFNFTRYGLLHGRVLSVSQDAIVRDKPQDKANDRTPGTQSATSELRGQELLYVARVGLERAQMQVDDRLINLTPGMAVTVEIKTGSRTIMSYLLSPIVRYKHDSIRER